MPPNFDTKHGFATAAAEDQALVNGATQPMRVAAVLRNTEDKENNIPFGETLLVLGSLKNVVQDKASSKKPKKTDTETQTIQAEVDEQLQQQVQQDDKKNEALQRENERLARQLLTLQANLQQERAEKESMAVSMSNAITNINSAMSASTHWCTKLGMLFARTGIYYTLGTNAVATWFGYPTLSLGVHSLVSMSSFLLSIGAIPVPEMILGTMSGFLGLGTKDAMVPLGLSLDILHADAASDASRYMTSAVWANPEIAGNVTITLLPMLFNQAFLGSLYRNSIGRLLFGVKQKAMAERSLEAELLEQAEKQQCGLNSFYKTLFFSLGLFCSTTVVPGLLMLVMYTFRAWMGVNSFWVAIPFQMYLFLSRLLIAAFAAVADTKKGVRGIKDVLLSGSFWWGRAKDLLTTFLSWAINQTMAVVLYDQQLGGLWRTEVQVGADGRTKTMLNIPDEVPIPFTSLSWRTKDWLFSYVQSAVSMRLFKWIPGPLLDVFMPVPTKLTDALILHVDNDSANIANIQNATTKKYNATELLYAAAPHRHDDTTRILQNNRVMNINAYLGGEDLKIDNGDGASGSLPRDKVALEGMRNQVDFTGGTLTEKLITKVGGGIVTGLASYLLSAVFTSGLEWAVKLIVWLLKRANTWWNGREQQEEDANRD